MSAMIATVDRGAPHRFVALDSLRGLAALLVVLHHINGAGYLLSLPLFRYGSLAVDFFFVLSGFVIAANYGERLTQGFSIGRFMALRLGRVYPLHLVVLAIFVSLELLQWRLGTHLTPREAFAGKHSLAQLGAEAAAGAGVRAAVVQRMERPELEHFGRSMAVPAGGMGLAMARPGQLPAGRRTGAGGGGGDDAVAV